MLESWELPGTRESEFTLLNAARESNAQTKTWKAGQYDLLFWPSAALYRSLLTEASAPLFVDLKVGYGYFLL